MSKDHRAKELVDLGNRLFDRRQPLMSFWQESADLFFPERGTFTRDFVLGDDYAAHLMDSYPSLLRNELGNSISAMLRPRERSWFRMTTLDEDRDSAPENAGWLEYVAMKMRRFMYHPNGGFVKSTKRCDHDFVTFGNGILSVEENQDRTRPFYRNFHLRSCVWLENSEGEIDHLHRKEMMSARNIKRMFHDADLHQSIEDACRENPHQEFEVRCITLPAKEYDYIAKKTDSKKERKLPFITIYVDVMNCKVLRERPWRMFPYIVPRWVVLDGSQYAISPCATISIPDARMAQSMSQIILESGEKSVDPPLVAVSEAIRDVNTAAGGLTWADIEFDGKLSETIRPIDFNNDMAVAFNMRTDMRELLAKAWYIEKLTLPRPEGAEQRTATEAKILEDEFIRNLLPLFEPMEQEYNSAVLDKTWDVMRNLGEFPAEEIPQDLSGEETSWTFESPIQASQQRMKASQFMEALQLIGATAEISPQTMQAPPIDLAEALQDVLSATSPAKWMLSDDEMAARAEQIADEQEAQAEMMQASQAAGVVKEGAEAAQQVGQAMLPPQLTGPGAQPALPPPSKQAA